MYTVTHPYPAGYTQPVEKAVLPALNTGGTSLKGELSNVFYGLMILVICPGAYVGQHFKGQTMR